MPGALWQHKIFINGGVELYRNHEYAASCTALEGVPVKDNARRSLAFIATMMRDRLQDDRDVERDDFATCAVDAMRELHGVFRSASQQ